MICYASHTNNRRNLAVLRRAGWGLLVTRARPQDWRTEGFERVAGDNGAWSDYRAGRSFNDDAYESFLAWAEGQTLDWLVLPDIVAGGLESLRLSRRYLNRCLSVCPLVLIAVQDGMERADLAPLVGPNVGIFLGGSTRWKLDRMADWGGFCAERGIYYHVARVNTTKRMSCAIAAGAHSIDGSSVSRYSVNLPKLDGARRQRDLFSPAM